MSPADELRNAADRLEKLAENATPSPWTVPRQLAVRAPIPDDEFGRVHTDDEDRVVVVQAQHFEGTRDLVRKRSAHDLDWIATMGPQAAAPLIAWLQHEAEYLADEQQTATEDCTECRGTGEVYDGDPTSFPCTDCTVTPYESGQYALAFARTILTEPGGTDA